MFKTSGNKKHQWIELLNVYAITAVGLIGTKLGTQIQLSQTCLMQAKGVKDESRVNSIIYNNSDKTLGHL